MIHFKEFCDKKGRWTKKQLRVLEKVLSHEKIKSEDHTDDEDPYLFVRADQDLSFDGIRIYKIGDKLAYRVQKESDTQPFGRAYPLSVEDMWDDFLTDQMNEEKAGKAVMEAIVGEIKKFFEKSLKAEQEIKTIEFDRKKMKLVNGNRSFYNQVGNKFE